MKFIVQGNLHLQSYSNVIIDTYCQWLNKLGSSRHLILTGNVASPYSSQIQFFLNRVTPHFKSVVLIPGLIELGFYKNYEASIQQHILDLYRLGDRYSNVHILYDQHHVINNVYIFGSTMLQPLSEHHTINEETNEQFFSNLLNDKQQSLTIEDLYREFNWSHYLMSRNLEHLEYINQEHNQQYKSLAVTHFPFIPNQSYPNLAKCFNCYPQVHSQSQYVEIRNSMQYPSKLQSSIINFDI